MQDFGSIGISKAVKMNRNQFRWLLSVGLLTLLGFTSCSPRLRMRQKTDVPSSVDTLRIPNIDTLRRKPELPPVKLMYGVPPTRFEKMEAPEKQLKIE